MPYESARAYVRSTKSRFNLLLACRQIMNEVSTSYRQMGRDWLSGAKAKRERRQAEISRGFNRNPMWVYTTCDEINWAIDAVNRHFQRTIKTMNAYEEVGARNAALE